MMVQYYDCIERVQSTYFKLYLNVGKYASNKAILGECGRYAMHVSTQVRVVKYWVKLLRMESSRYPHQCYLFLKQLDENGKQTWVSDVRHLLFTTGFSYMWIAQDVGNLQLFVNVFSQRAKDIYFQIWHESLCTSSFLYNYSTFKSLLQPELYITALCDKTLIRSFCKLRIALHALKVNLVIDKNVVKMNMPSVQTVILALWKMSTMYCSFVSVTLTLELNIWGMYIIKTYLLFIVLQTLN